jgi:hypothetical protein
MEERCESCRKVLGRGWKYDSAGEVKLCPRCYAALRQEPAESELLKHAIEAAGELEVYARRGELGDWSDPIVRAAVLSIHALFERLSAVLSFCETPDPRGGILGFRAVEDILAIIRGRL